MDPQKVERRKRFIIDIIYLGIVLVLAFLFLEYALKWIMPFLLGFLVSLLFRPLVRFLTRITRLNRRFCAFLTVVLGYILLGFLLWKGGKALFQSLRSFGQNLPSLYTNEISPFFGAANQGLLHFMERFSPETAEQLGQVLSGMLDGIQQSLSDLSGNILSALASASTRVPLALISLIFTILSSLYISMDYDKVSAFIKRQIPEKQKEVLRDIRSYLGVTLASYAKAYLILMCITFVELSVGLLALRVRNPFRLAAIIAIADAFPVLGTGTIVLPWAVISLFQQRYYLALGLTLLYVIVTVVRQFIEPKVVGDQLGLPPLVSLICIYLGFVWFGVKGAILFPVTMTIILCLHQAEKLHIWK